MKLKELTDKVAEEYGCSKRDALEVVKTFLSILRFEIAKRGEVTLTHFGTFRVVERAPRKGRNPHTGKSIMIPAKKTIRFRPAYAMKAWLS